MQPGAPVSGPACWRPHDHAGSETGAPPAFRVREQGQTEQETTHERVRKMGSEKCGRREWGRAGRAENVPQIQGDHRWGEAGRFTESWMRNDTNSQCQSVDGCRTPPLTPTLSPPPRKGEGGEGRRGPSSAIPPVVIGNWYDSVNHDFAAGTPKIGSGQADLDTTSNLILWVCVNQVPVNAPDLRRFKGSMHEAFVP